MCQHEASALTAVGSQISADLTAEFANSYTDQFHDFRALLVSVCGRPVLQRYDNSSATDHHNVASVTKSVVSTLIGIALTEGFIRGLDETLAQLLPQHAADMSPAVASLTLRQLLTMTAGLDIDGQNASVGSWIESTDFVGNILRHGSKGTGQFGYSSATTHILAAILARATGRPVLDYAREKLFDPLGIETRPAATPLMVPASAAEYDAAGFAWPVDHQGINFGPGWLKLTPSDMLKIGQLYLDNGQLDGRQLVPVQWVHDATAAQVSTISGPYGSGYGYQWWVTNAGADAAFAAVGFGGQLIEVVPSRHLVVVFSTDLTSDPNQIVRAESRAYELMVERFIAPRITP
jgi:CubicO group peptidase (beta-lactamase class C family)